MLQVGIFLSIFKYYTTLDSTFFLLNLNALHKAGNFKMFHTKNHAIPQILTNNFFEVLQLEKFFKGA